MNNDFQIHDIQMGMWYNVEIEENADVVYNANFKIVSNGIEIFVDGDSSDEEGFVSINLDILHYSDLDIMQVFMTRKFHSVKIKRNSGDADGLLFASDDEIMIIELGDEMLDIRCYWIRSFLSLDYKHNVLSEEKANFLFEIYRPSALMMNN